MAEVCARPHYASTADCEALLRYRFLMGSIAVRSATLSTGVTVPYAETGDPSGIPVVLVHGYVESWRYFEPVLRLLPDSIHAYAFSQRGHGDADRPPDGYTPADLVADLVAFMDSVGLEAAALVGSSSGGVVAQLVAV